MWSDAYREKSKVMVLGGLEVPVHQVFVNGTQLEHVPDFKFKVYIE